MNGDEFKFKAEIDFDGREITRAYLSTVDMEQILKEINNARTLEELEAVLLRHGEQVIDTLGAHVDRLESDLKKKNSDLRHIDLEVLWPSIKSEAWLEEVFLTSFFSQIFILHYFKYFVVYAA